MIVKYKVSDFAKDLNLSAKKVLDELAAMGSTGKKNSSNLEENELNYLLEKFSKDNSVANLDEFLNSAKAPKEEPKAEKKAGRIAAEGITRVASEGNTAVVVEVNSETDFVAKNATFQEFVQAVADKALKASVDKAGDGEDVCAILDMQSELEEKTLTIGEKLSIRRFQKITGDCVASYIHGGGRIGVLVAADGASNDAIKEALTNVAMQIAALKPQYTSDSEVSAEYIEHEKEILMAQIQNDPKESQKPAKVIEELKEICLLDQTYVKAEDGKQSVAKYVEQVAKENGAKITVKGFVRYETGDGIEKKEENFAEEVAKQMAQ